MDKKKFKFSPETLEYIEVKLSTEDKLKRVGIYFAASIVISLLYFLIYLKISDTPEEKMLRRENTKLLEAYNNLDKEVESLSQNISDIETRDKEIYRNFFDTKALPESYRKGGTGGTDKYKQFDEINDKDLVISTAKKIDQLNYKAKIESKSLEDLLKLAISRKEELKHIPAIQPVENEDLRRTGSGFGMRFHPILKIYRPHEGIDFIGPKGSEIYATAEGKVSSVRWSTTFGNVIEINHGYGYLTLYGHLSKFNVKQGQKVKRGDIIGFMGGTGLSSGVHLHYEIHKDGVEIDPVPYFFKDLSPDDFVKLKAIADSIQISMD